MLVMFHMFNLYQKIVWSVVETVTTKPTHMFSSNFVYV